MEIYLIRHTAPNVVRGTCYGQSDIGLAETFGAEADVIAQHVPANIEAVYSSPLRRCVTLAARLFPGQAVREENDWMEINCGRWELQHWDHLPPEELQPWQEDRINNPFPGGESYADLYNRTVRRFQLVASEHASAAIVTHGGVLRSLFAHITGTTLEDAFGKFRFYYGCVIRLTQENGLWQFTILSNVPHAGEQHKPAQ